MRVLVVGGGGREHALAWKLQKSASVTDIHCAPGNPGMAEIGECHSVGPADIAGLRSLSAELDCGLVVVGPEAPLELGLAESLRQDGVRVFGPGRDGARLETSKAWAKAFMTRHGIPTAGYRTVSNLGDGLAYLKENPGPMVVKASGLAAGKGVTVAADAVQAESSLKACFEQDAFGEAGRTVVLEERLEGQEVSVFVLTDGTRWTLLPSSQDHKRALDGDLGPNTGGMGAYSPAPVLDDAARSRVVERILEPTLRGLRSEGVDYRGLLYLGLMLTDQGPQVIEYNVRFGDPETQAVLPRVDGDLAAWMTEAADGGLASAPYLAPEIPGASVCVVAAAEGYPGSYERGLEISGIKAARAMGVEVFHAGTALNHGSVVTAGGRVLSVSAHGSSLRSACDSAYRALGCITFPGMWFRKDIGHRALV